MKKILNIVTENNVTNINTNMQGKELYQAYVALTVHIAMQLIEEKEIETIGNQAVADALKIIEKCNVTGEKLL